MKHPNQSLAKLVLLSVTMLAAHVASAGTFVWDVATPGANNWNVNANWSPATGNPGSGDTALFGATGVSPDSVTVNNVVSVNTTITALSYTNSTAGTWHVTQIPASTSLTVSGTVTVGSGNATGLSTSAAMTGNGTFVATGTAFTLGNTAASGTATPGTLDLSGLDNFVYSASGGTIALGTTGSRSAGNLILAAVSNSVTAGTINIAGATGTASTQTFSLGAGTNNINAGTINVGAGRSTTSFQFATGTGGLRLRGTGGTDSDRSTMVVGNRNTGGTGNLTTTGNVFLNGHPVDMKLGTLTLGRMSRSGTEVNFNGVGVFQFDQGTVDATTINMGFCDGNSTNAQANGTLTVGASGVLTVGNISLVNVSATAGGTTGSGTLNVNGGTATCTGNIAKTTATGTGTISVNSGSLAVQGRIGSVAIPVDNLDLSNANLTLAASATTTNVAVVNLTTGGSTNIINISFIPAVTAYPAQIPIISYSGAIGGAGFDNNVGLGSLPPASPSYAGYLSNNTATLTIDLVITGGPAPAQQILWSGAQNGDWDTSTLNWLAGVTATNYNNAGDFVTFDDNASAFTVQLVTPTLTPGSITVTNNSQPYTFAGSGKLSGATGLTKQGSAMLTIANSVANDFSGSIALDAGTLNLDQPINVTVANPISGAGALVKSGANTLTLSGPNNFTGGLIVSNGVLRATTGAAPGTTTVAVYSGGTFVAGALQTNNYTLAGGTFGVVSGAMNVVPGELTAAAATTSTLYLADPQNLAATDATELSFTNTWRGSGNVTVLSVTNDTSPDSGNGLRLRGTAPSDFSGTITLGNMVKGELQTAVAGPFSPAGSGKLVLTCGTYYGTNGTLAPGIGGYSELNLRNNNAGDTVLGNDVELLGAGLTLLDPLGSAPAGSKVTMGNLKMGAGQELGVYLSAQPAHVIVFPTVTLTGGTATFSPKTPGFGAVTSAGSDLSLGDIIETAPSSITMNGRSNLFLTGTSTYTGTTTVSNGTLTVNGSLLGIASVTVYGGTLSGTGLISGPVTIASGGTLSPGSSIGTLAINNSLTLSGTNIMELNKSGAVLTSDLITNVTTLNVGGTLILTITGDALASGDTFKLYSFTTPGAGDFAAIIPASPGTDLFWDTSKLKVDGTLRVIGHPVINEISLLGTDVVLNGANGIPGSQYIVLTSTNIATPIINWSPLTTNMFDGSGLFSFTNAMDPAVLQRFYLIQLVP